MYQNWVSTYEYVTERGRELRREAERDRAAAAVRAARRATRHTPPAGAPGAPAAQACRDCPAGTMMGVG